MPNRELNFDPSPSGSPLGAGIRTIGKYQVSGVVGRGGMGVVYKAIDPLIGRSVAIKMVTAGVTEDPDLLKRFYREAQSTGSLQHPNIVTVYELGEQNGTPYLVMEYLEGESLESMIANRREVAMVEKLEFVIQICNGLAYAHRHNVIHRDIKPANAVVLKDRTLKIVDFGIARLGNDRFTRTGQVIGSFFYMSPEQINGSEVDTRTDVYSTGVVLYELLAYAHPFQGNDTGSTLMKILHQPAPPLSTFLTACPAELDAVLQRAMAKDRDERYQSAEDFSFDLQRVQEDVKHQLVSEYLQLAERAVEASEWNKAKEFLRQVLKFERQHPRANELMRELQHRIEKQQRSEQLQQLNALTEEAITLHDWEQAFSYLEQALKLDKDNVELVARYKRLREERVRFVEALRGAESAHRAGDLEKAKQAVEDALTFDPSDTQAKALHAILLKEITERQKRQRVERLVEEARKEISSRHFTAALDLLGKAESIDRSSPSVRELIALSLNAQEQERRRKQLDQVSSEIEDLMNRDEYAAAVEKGEAGLRKFPGDPGLIKLKEFAEQQRENWARRLYIESRTVTARELLDRGNAADALTVLEGAARKFPDDSGLTSLLSVVRAAHAREQADRDEAERAAVARRVQMEQQISHCRELLDRGLPHEAIEILHPLARSFPQNRDVESMMALAQRSIERASAEREAGAYVQQAIATVKTLLHSGRLEEALCAAEEANRRSSHPDLLQLLGSVREAAAREQREQADQARTIRQLARARERDLAELRLVCETIQSTPNVVPQKLTLDRIQEIAEKYAADPEIGLAAGQARQQLLAASAVNAATVPPRSATELLAFPSAPPPVSDEFSNQGVVPRTQAAAVPLLAPEPEHRRGPVLVPPPPTAKTRHFERLYVVLAAALMLAVAGAAIVPRLLRRPVTAIQVKISTVPEGATVRIGRTRCVTPDCQLPLAPGDYQLEAELAGYQTVVTPLKVNPVEPGPSLTISLTPLPPPAEQTQPASPTIPPEAIPTTAPAVAAPPAPATAAAVALGTLLVRTGVDGVSVFINGKKYGTSARGGLFRLQLKPRDYDVRVDKQGYQPAPTQHVQVRPNQETAMVFTLEPQPTAQPTVRTAQASWLMIGQAPPDAEVLINGKIVGTIQKDGTFSDQLAPGDYTIQLVKDINRSLAIWRHLEAGQTANLLGSEIKFPPALPPLKPQQTPPSATTAAGSPVPTTVATAPPPVSAVSSPPTSSGAAGKPTLYMGDTQAILAALDRYKEAYESESVDEIAKAWPSLSKKQKKGLAEFFKGVQATRMTLRHGSPVINGDRATVVCQQSVIYTRDGKVNPPTPVETVTLTLRRNGPNSWVVDSLR